MTSRQIAIVIVKAFTIFQNIQDSFDEQVFLVQPLVPPLQKNKRQRKEKVGETRAGLRAAEGASPGARA